MLRLRFKTLLIGEVLELNHTPSVTVRGDCTISNEIGETRRYTEGFAAEANIRLDMSYIRIEAHSVCEVDFLEKIN